MVQYHWLLRKIEKDFIFYITKINKWLTKNEKYGVFFLKTVNRLADGPLEFVSTHVIHAIRSFIFLSTTKDNVQSGLYVP